MEAKEIIRIIDTMRKKAEKYKKLGNIDKANTYNSAADKMEAALKRPKTIPVV